MSRVAIVDYGMGNLDSVVRAVEECGGSPLLTDRAEDLADASHIILPGVGAFRDGMENLKAAGWVEALGRAVREDGVPFLGICLGMQLLAESGAESGAATGLGWIPGSVVKLVAGEAGERIPHVGWNEVSPVAGTPLFASIEPATDFYFVHSYHVECLSDEHVLARTPYCGLFASAIGRDNIVGVQFHPEKSQKPGFRVLGNFLAQ